jgi:hypothetical protein
VDPGDTLFENVNRLRFRSGNYGNDNNNGPPYEGKEPPPGDNHGDSGDNGPSPNNDNINTSLTVPPRVGTHANPVQANIQPRTAGRNIRGNVADNDDISSVSSTSSRSKEDVKLVVQSTDTIEGDNSWDTDMTERDAPLGKYREPLIPPYRVNDSWVNREEWLDDIKYCLKRGYVWCHQCKEWVRKKYHEHRGREGAGCHWRKKCPWCATYGYNKRIDKGL